MDSNIVLAEDLFGNQITSSVNFSWIDDQGNLLSNTEGYPDLPVSGVSPMTFKVDPSFLGAGTYYILITGSKDGFIEGETTITMIVRGATFFETGEIVVGIAGLWVLGIILGFAWQKGNLLLGRAISCPHCGESTSSKMPACKNCGNHIEKKIEIDDILDEKS